MWLPRRELNARLTRRDRRRGGADLRPQSIESIAEAIERTTSDAELRRRLRTAGLETRRYSWSAAAAAYREAYEVAAAMA